jgi:hypothetical protein
LKARGFTANPRDENRGLTPDNGKEENGESNMKVNVTNTEALTAALEAVNGRATAHTMAPGQVLDLAERIEADLQGRGVPKKYLKGARVIYIPAGPGKAYARKSHHVVSTRVELERGASGWFLTGAERKEIWAESPERLLINVTAEARAAIRARAFVNIAE